MEGEHRERYNFGYVVQDDKNKLLQSLRSKAQKNEEKEKIIQFSEHKNFSKGSTEEFPKEQIFV